MDNMKVKKNSGNNIHRYTSTRCKRKQPGKASYGQHSDRKKQSEIIEGNIIKENLGQYTTNQQQTLYVYCASSITTTGKNKDIIVFLFQLAND